MKKLFKTYRGLYLSLIVFSFLSCGEEKGWRKFNVLNENGFINYYLNSKVENECNYSLQFKMLNNPFQLDSNMQMIIVSDGEVVYHSKYSESDEMCFAKTDKMSKKTFEIIIINNDNYLEFGDRKSPIYLDLNSKENPVVSFVFCPTNERGEQFYFFTLNYNP